MALHEPLFPGTGSFPPLPDLIPHAEPPQLIEKPILWPPLLLRTLRAGAYIINYTPVRSRLVSFDGTMRVEAHAAGRTVSGDLYQRPILRLPFPYPKTPVKPIHMVPILASPPDPTLGIPIFPRNQYRYYLRVTKVLEFFTVARSFTLGFEMYRFTKTAEAPGFKWTLESGALTAEMTWQPAPAPYRATADYLAGDVKNADGVVIGQLTMGWVSPYLRKATIEVDRVNASEAPVNNGAGVDWKTMGDSVDWDLTIDLSNSDIAEPSGESWSDAECHATMLARRDASDLDAEWRYHVLCVRRLDSTERGIMYDAYGGDSNNIPREGCAISSHWTIPSTPEWGTVQGMRFGTATAPYFRTAVHETGHALCLYHNTADNGIMNTTDVIAAHSLDPGSPAFPADILWAYNGDDAKRLRHMPDIYVRPGGVPFGVPYPTAMMSPTDLRIEANELELNVTPIVASIPLGAPVRIDIELVNKSTTALFAPKTLSLKSGFVTGYVIDIAGDVRRFQTIVRCVEDQNLAMLMPEGRITDSITLLRGPQGALFPAAGAHKIVVEAHWDFGGVDTVVTGTAEVMVTPAVDTAHAETALTLLSEPDTLLTLVFGGDHMTNGIEAIRKALDNPILRPHYAYVEAKRLAAGFADREPDVAKAAKLIDGSTVMSSREVEKAARFVEGKPVRAAKGAKTAKEHATHR